MDEISTSELMLLIGLSAGVAICAFVYWAHVSFRLLPRSISGAGYRVALSALALFFCIAMTLALLLVYYDDAWSHRHTRVAGLIGDVGWWLFYAGVFALALSILSAGWGLVRSMLKRRRRAKFA